MAVSSKTLGIAAGTVIVVAVGGYLGAQAVVGNEVEKSLDQAFNRLDASPSWRVTDVQIDKSLFDTAATATLHMVGYEELSADIDLLVDHGVFRSPVTGTLRPNEALSSGVIDIDMVASLSGVEGQLTADRLNLLEVDGEINGWTMDISFADEQHWNVDIQTDEIMFTDDRVEDVTFHFFSSRVQIDTRGDEGNTVQQHIDMPRIEVLAQGLTFYLDDTELEAVTEPVADTQLVNQNGYVRMGDMRMEETSLGSLYMEMGANNLDMQALQDFQKAYMPLERMQQVRQQQPDAVDEARYRDHLIASIESGHALLNESPGFTIDPLEAHIVLPEWGLDFEPRLTMEMRFDGENLSKEALYGAFWDSGLAPPPAQEEAADANAAQASASLFERVYMNISMTTPPEETMMLVPMPFSFMLDPSLEQQTLLFDQGRVTLNGEELM